MTRGMIMGDRKVDNCRPETTANLGKVEKKVREVREVPGR
jgi:hypothetical protein